MINKIPAWGFIGSVLSMPIGYIASSEPSEAFFTTVGMMWIVFGIWMAIVILRQK